MRKTIIAALVVAVVVAGAAILWILSAPAFLGEGAVSAEGAGDPEKGRMVFIAGGCASCHATGGKEPSDIETPPQLGGGLRLTTPFGAFVAPNISPDPDDGIGDWSLATFANAMQRGIGEHGEHLYPAFPYTSYARMTPEDIADLHAYLKTLPPVAGRAPGHELSFPFNVRRGLGLWQRLHLDDQPVVAIDGADPLLARGRYLVEGPGHCGECHTPRNIAGGLRTDRWLGGAPAAEGDGKVPNITGGKGGIGDWSAADIAYYLESGFTPDFDSVGGAMVAVQAHMAQLPARDRQAIAAYLKAVPPVDSAQ